jgi:hypothetical protein
MASLRSHALPCITLGLGITTRRAASARLSLSDCGPNGVEYCLDSHESLS